MIAPTHRGIAAAVPPFGLLFFVGCSNHGSNPDTGIVVDAQTVVAMDAAVDSATDFPADLAPDAASERSFLSATGGAGGADAPSGAGGVIGTDGGAAAVDVQTQAEDALGADSPPDVPVGGSGGTGGTTATAGMTSGSGGTSAGGATTSGGISASGGTTNAGGSATTGGTAASGGSGGVGASGGTSAGGATPPSCRGFAAICGPSGDESCCTSLPVPGGTFYRSYDNVTYVSMSHPATVADFYLDKYQITVGRFRQFVNAGTGTQASPPASGAGAHPLIAGSGWDLAWNANLSADAAALKASLKCSATDQTWTDTAGANESQPQNCMDWYTAFAFCAWDGGRLPTEAEWNYAAAGGSEQRAYPWSIPPTSTTIDDSYAVYCGSSCSGTQNVGSKSPKGDGKWGQADLAGNLWEWTLDWLGSYQSPCSNCADLIDMSADSRVVRGGRFYGKAPELLSSYRGSAVPAIRNHYIGSRCARAIPE
jgi:formylglycine-generating enzyme required for sulfatase activity